MTASGKEQLIQDVELHKKIKNSKEIRQFMESIRGKNQKAAQDLQHTKYWYNHHYYYSVGMIGVMMYMIYVIHRQVRM